MELTLFFDNCRKVEELKKQFSELADVSIIFYDIAARRGRELRSGSVTSDVKKKYEAARAVFRQKRQAFKKSARKHFRVIPKFEVADVCKYFRS